MKEIWKDIDGYSGYQVSNFGRVRTKDKITFTKKHGERHWKDRILKPKISNKDKCLRVDLWKNGKHKTILVHRLVANAFLEKNIDTNLTVNHKDGNRLNNRVDNLEWLTLADNIRHAFNTGLQSNQIKIKLINKSDNSYRIFRSASETSRAINKNHGYISSKVRQNIFENKDFKWEVL